MKNFTIHENKVKKYERIVQIFYTYGQAENQDIIKVIKSAVKDFTKGELDNSGTSANYKVHIEDTTLGFMLTVDKISTETSYSLKEF